MIGGSHIRLPDVFNYYFKDSGEQCFCSLMKPRQPLVRKLDVFLKKMFNFHLEAELKYFIL